MDGYSTAGEKAQPTSLGGEGLDHQQLTANYAWVKAVARNLVRDPWGAEDVTQETLLAALAAPPRDVPDEQRLRAWLGRVAFNLSRLGARQGARRRAREVRVARRESLPSVSDELEAAGTIDALSSAITDLSEPYRGVVLMRYFDGLSTAEIAARTGSSELAVRKRLWRARNKLRAALEHDPASGRLLAAILPWVSWARRTGARELAGLAGGLALCAGAAWWLRADERGDERRPLALAQGAVVRAEHVSQVDPDPSPRSEPTSPQSPARPPSRRPLPPGSTPSHPPTPVAPEPSQVSSGAGFVLDLEGAARAGLELVSAGSPARVLSTSDALGSFRIPLADLPLTIEARGEGWTTIVRARFESAADSKPQPLVVATAEDLVAHVRDAAGYPVAGARFELGCEESAFARIPFPVRVESSVLRTFLSGADGVCSERELPRGSGLVLSIHAEGFEAEERPTLDLGREECFVLRRLAPEAVLAGTVWRRSGVPAAGAIVSLAQASTQADSAGRFRLPLRGVRPDSSLAARDPDRLAAPTELSHFGARLRAGLDREVEIELGEEHDPVAGKLVGDEHGGWLLAAYPAEGGRLDPEGVEAPAALTTSAPGGAFRFALARGAYDLVALAPEGPRVVRRAALESRAGTWTVPLPPAAPFSALRGHLRTTDEDALDEARIQVRIRVDGPAGHRLLAWKELASDARGAFAFERDPALALELEIEHPSLGRTPRRLAVPAGPAGAALELALSRPAFVQVVDAGPSAASLAVLDARGSALRAHGPLRSAHEFGLRSGWSAVLEVPSEARWLELKGANEAALRLPIAPIAGEVLQLRP